MVIVGCHGNVAASAGEVMVALGRRLDVVTVMVLAALVVVAPRLSVARAVSVYEPGATPVQSYVYGAVVSSPSLADPLKNSTLLTVPSESVALAASETVAGAVNAAPFAGCVSAAPGAALLLTVTIFATEGTPLASTATSMYAPGGAMLALAGPVAVSNADSAVKVRGT